MSQEAGIMRPGRTRVLPLGLMFLLFLALPLTPARGQAGPPGEVINQARKAVVITPSDTVDLALGPTRYVFVGAAAACPIAMILMDDTASVLFANVAGTSFLPVRAKRILATGTTCTPIIGLW
jgi:hypothetical protein